METLYDRIRKTVVNRSLLQSRGLVAQAVLKFRDAQKKKALEEKRRARQAIYETEMASKHFGSSSRDVAAFLNCSEKLDKIPRKRLPPTANPPAQQKPVAVPASAPVLASGSTPLSTPTRKRSRKSRFGDVEPAKEEKLVKADEEDEENVIMRRPKKKTRTSPPPIKTLSSDKKTSPSEPSRNRSIESIESGQLLGQQESSITPPTKKADAITADKGKDYFSRALDLHFESRNIRRPKPTSSLKLDPSSNVQGAIPRLILPRRPRSLSAEPKLPLSAMSSEEGNSAAKILVSLGNFFPPPPEPTAAITKKRTTRASLRATANSSSDDAAGAAAAAAAIDNPASTTDGKATPQTPKAGPSAKAAPSKATASKAGLPKAGPSKGKKGKTKLSTKKASKAKAKGQSNKKKSEPQKAIAKRTKKQRIKESEDKIKDALEIPKTAGRGKKKKAQEGSTKTATAPAPSEVLDDEITPQPTDRLGKCARGDVYVREPRNSRNRQRKANQPTSSFATGIKSSRESRQANRVHQKGVNRIKASSDLLSLNQLTQRRRAVGFGQSDIHGKGLFAKETIESGEFIIEYIGELVRGSVADIREKRYGRQGMGDSYLFRLSERWVVDATKKGGIARYINHSCEPNVTAKIITISNEPKIVFYSKHQIKEGEELTYDYKFDFEAEDKKIPCLCRATSCRKSLN